MPREVIKALQVKRLQQVLERVYHNVGFYKKSFDAAKVKPDDIEGSTFSISNLGMYGVREFLAVINPPHATILAVGATRRAPIEAEDGSVKFISQMTVTLSCDHRVVDGALGAELLAAFKKFVEAPVTALV
jgi:pyruvate dehydrogenase E2 component (dihydrolipoamide acetyltransferase)